MMYMDKPFITNTAIFHKNKNVDFEFMVTKLSRNKRVSALKVHVPLLTVRVIVNPIWQPWEALCVFSHMWESHEIRHFPQREGR